MLIVALAIGLALLIQAFVVKPYQIPSESMEPTLDVGERVLVNRVGYHLGDPQIGDIVVFHPPAGAENGQECGVDQRPGEPCPEPTKERSDTNFIKRIVAGPGDTLRIRERAPGGQRGGGRGGLHQALPPGGARAAISARRSPFHPTTTS